MEKMSKKDIEEIVSLLIQEADDDVSLDVKDEDENKQLLLDKDDDEEEMDLPDEEEDTSGSDDEYTEDEMSEQGESDSTENEKEKLINNLNRLLLIKKLLEEILSTKYNNEISALVNQAREIIEIVIDKVSNDDSVENIGEINKELDSLIRLTIIFVKKKLGIDQEESKEEVGTNEQEQ